MNILITGAYSLLGSALLTTRPKNISVVTSYHKKKNDFSNIKNISSIQIDITQKENIIHNINRINPAVIIHAAAISNVDYCEKNKQLAKKVNIDGTKHIIEAARQRGVTMLFISTNAVFDGKTPPYSEESTLKPINYYGETKAICEELIQKSGLPFVIVRLTTMYGWRPDETRDNPATFIINKLSKQEVLPMVTDHFVNLLYNKQAGNAIWKIILKKYTGVIHIAGSERISRFDFAKKIAKTFLFPQKLIKPVKSSYFKTIAKRPSDTTFTTEKMAKILRITPLSIIEGLEKMKQEKSI